MRSFAGKILIRVPPGVHKQLAKEAFESGRSINQLCLEAIVARKALKNYNPWKGIEEVRDKNKGIDEKELQREIYKALRDVRHGK